MHYKLKNGSTLQQIYVWKIFSTVYTRIYVLYNRKYEYTVLIFDTLSEFFVNSAGLRFMRVSL